MKWKTHPYEKDHKGLLYVRRHPPVYRLCHKRNPSLSGIYGRCCEVFGRVHAVVGAGPLRLHLKGKAPDLPPAEEVEEGEAQPVLSTKYRVGASRGLAFLKAPAHALHALTPRPAPSVARR